VLQALNAGLGILVDLHQPLHDEDDGDKCGNTRHMIFDGKRDNLHWVWDTGLLEHVNRNEDELAAEMEQRITPQERAEWEKGSFEDWVLEGHALAQSVAYGDLGSGNPAVISAAYERQADPVVEIQLEKAGVRLAYLLNMALR
jgi:S1/P1 Nuclease